MRGVLLPLFSVVSVACAYGVAVDDSPQDIAPSTREQTTPASLAKRQAPRDTADAATADATVDSSIIADASTPIDAPVDAKNGSVWSTPTCDGAVSSNEYGGSNNQWLTSGGQTWSMAWDATNLYIAVEGANLAEAIVVYVAINNSGLSSGQIYDGTRPSTLSFSANAVAYAKQNYDETRIVANGAWGSANANTLKFCGSGTTREVVLPWSALGSNGIPSDFRWVGYATSPSGWVYGQAPSTLPGGQIGTSANFPNDYYVASTNDGNGNYPFAKTE
jgi:hypothetical protein